MSNTEGTDQYYYCCKAKKRTTGIYGMPFGGIQEPLGGECSFYCDKDAEETEEDNSDSYQSKRIVKDDNHETGCFMLILLYALIMFVIKWGISGVKYYFAGFVILLFLLFKTPLSIKVIVNVASLLFLIGIIYIYVIR